jgi:hypothetical protein
VNLNKFRKRMVVTSQSLVKNNFEGGLKLGDSVNFIASADSYFFTERIVNYRCDIFLLFRPPSGIAGLSWFELVVPENLIRARLAP